MSTGIASRSPRVAPTEALVYKNYTIPPGVRQLSINLSLEFTLCTDIIEIRLGSARPTTSFSQTPRFSLIRTFSTQRDGCVLLQNESGWIDTWSTLERALGFVWE